MQKNNEFNFKKENTLIKRIRFSSNIRTKGIGHVPIVIDSYNNNISELLGNNDIQVEDKWRRHGISKEYHMDLFIYNVKQDIMYILDKQSSKFVLYVEDHHCYDYELLGDLYKKYRDKEDNILYIEVKENKSVIETYLRQFVYYKDILVNNIKNKFSNIT